MLWFQRKRDLNRLNVRVDVNCEWRDVLTFWTDRHADGQMETRMPKVGVTKSRPDQEPFYGQLFSPMQG